MDSSHPTAPDAQRTLDEPRKRAGRRQEGATMMMVMLILLVATASAAVSVHSVQTELRAAGHNRQAVQTQYVAEAALMTTIVWLDKVSDSGELELIIKKSDKQPMPSMFHYAQPEYTSPEFRQHAMYSGPIQQAMNRQDFEVSPMSGPQDPAAGSGGSGGSGGVAAPQPDLIGSFGPQQAYQPQQRWYVHINECKIAPAGMTAGSPAAGIDDSKRPKRQFFCVLTAFGRTVLKGYDQQNPVSAPGKDGHNWAIGANVYQSSKFAAAHDTRATILTSF